MRAIAEKTCFTMTKRCRKWRRQSQFRSDNWLFLRRSSYRCLVILNTSSCNLTICSGIGDIRFSNLSAMSLWLGMAIVLCCRLSCVICSIVVFLTSAEVIVIQFFANVTQYLKILFLVSGIEFFKLLSEHLQQNIGIAIIDSTLGIFMNITEVLIT